MPEAYNENESLMRVSRKSLFQTGTSLPMMRFLRPCQATACAVFEFCSHDKYGKCGFEAEFLRTVLEPFEEIFKANPNKRHMVTFGLQIIPLYMNLCRILMLTASLKNIEYMDAKGRYQIHPAYREQLLVVNAINTAIRISGLGRFFERAEEDSLPKEISPVVEIDEEGDYHASLEA